MTLWKPFDNVPPTGEKPFTDLSRWRLLVNDGGRQTWHYLKTDEEIAKWPQTKLDKYWLGLDMDIPNLPPAKNAFEAARNGYNFYKYLQSEEGPWTGECGGAIFLLPTLVISSYVAGMPFEDEERLEMIRFLMNTANHDGGWGFHIEGPSTLFGTGISYVTLRILGLSKDHPVCVKARRTIHKMGGAIAIPTWGKFFLAMINCYDWEGNNSIPPELWLLPDWSPVHPHRWWIHCRASYLPMSYIYGVRLKMEENDLILSLRNELFLEDYYSINWPAQRNNINGPDVFAHHTKLYDTISFFTYLYEQCPLPPLRRAGIARAYELVILDDENTGYETADSVAKMLNLVVRVHAEGRDAESYEQHRLKRPDFMWMESRGLMMSGTNGTQLWDTAFVMQGVVSIGLGKYEENKESLVRALTWIEGAQMMEDPMHYHTAYRHTTKGAWGFSTREQGYTVSDCTGEGLKAVLHLQYDLDYTPKVVSKERLCDAVDVMLSLRNAEGGFGSYELRRAPYWLEWLNPSEVFGTVMLDYPCPECTTSVITALSMFKKHFPDYRARDIDHTIKGAIKFLHKTQRPDGSWVGSWGVCFTYAMHFALEGLSLVGETYENSTYARKACEYLLGKQRKDGGWGESLKSCEQSVWVEHENTQVVQTSWAVMGLVFAKYPYPEPIERGVQLVMSRQRPDGSWAQEAVEGVANQTIPMNYPNFKFAFTIWMLGHAHKYLAKLKKGGKY